MSDPGRDRGRAVALRGRLLAPRRADRGAARAPGARLPLRRRRRALRPAGDDRPDRAPVRSRRSSTRAGGVLDCHLMVESPERHIAQFARGRRRQRHGPRRGLPGPPGRRRARAGARAAVGLAFNPETSVERARPPRCEAEVDLVLCMSIHPGYSGQAFMPEAFERVARLRSLLPDSVPSRSTAASGRRTSRALREAGATLFVAGRGDLRPRGPAARVPRPRVQARSA